MIDSIPARRAVVAAIMAMLIALAACGKKDEDRLVADDKEAAVENVDAMSREHANDTADASEAVSQVPTRAVTAERMAYAEVGSELVYGHFAFPSDMIEPLPAIIMIHEWWGLNDNIRAVAERLAGEGYIVLAVDLFGGDTAENPESARQLMLQAVEDPEGVTSNIEQAFAFVSETAGAPSVASLGWCFGGGWSLNTAMMFPERLNAAVIYYGQVTDDEEKLRPIQASILGFFGDADQGIKINSVNRFEEALERLRKDHDIHVYAGAGHAFANPTGNNYDADYAEDAWTKTLAFLRDKLSSDES